jgi:hypothetical protein
MQDLIISPLAHCILTGSYTILSILTGVFNGTVTTKVFNEIGTMAGFAHTSFLLGSFISAVLLKKYSFLYLYKWRLRLFIANAIMFSSALCFQHVIYYNLVITSSPIYASLKNTMMLIFNSWIIMQSCVLFLQALDIALFIISFIISRKAQWNHIANIENALSFHSEFKVHFDTMCSLKDCFNTQEFMQYWMTKSEDDILQEMPQKAQRVFSILQEHLDIDNNGSIDFAEFSRFASQYNVIDKESIWKIMSNGESNINETRMINIMMDLAFSRRSFAYTVYTDFLVVQWLMNYVSIVLLAGALIIVLRMLGYADAFGQGFDLFKIYVLVTTYLATHVNDKMRFLLLMSFNRPYNIGDIILYNNEPCIVVQICPGFTNLQGRTFMIVPSDLMLNQPILNLTRDTVMDTMEVSLPINFEDCTETMHCILKEYARLHPEINGNSIRCGWVSVNCSDGKTFQCNWTYTMKIHDRSRYLMIRTQIYDYIIQSLNDSVIHKALVLQAACGGAYNEKIKYE